MKTHTIVEVTGDEIFNVAALEVQSRLEGLDLVVRARRDWFDGTNRFDRRGEGLFAATTNHGPGIVGICGLSIDPYLADPSVGRLRHLYVLPSSRCLGVGRRLVESCLDLAKDSFERVRLRTSSAAAERFYSRIGFRSVNEADATHSLHLGEWRSTLSTEPRSRLVDGRQPGVD